MLNNKVSIIIPVYNVEKFLARCLDSALNQTYTNIEVIIVNDGSPDNSQKIIDEYAKDDSRVISLKQKNMGLSEARNTGMKRATGEYYYFLDSDDYITNDAIKNMIEQIGANDILISNMTTFDDKGNFLKRPSIDLKEIDNKNMLDSIVQFDYFYGSAYGINACNKLYKASFIKTVGLRFQKNDEIYAEDLLFNLKCYVNQPRIKVINQYTYFYYQNINSITKQYKPLLSDRFKKLTLDFIEYCKTLRVIDKYETLITFTICIASSNIAKNTYDRNNCSVKDIEEELRNYFKSDRIRKYLDPKDLKSIEDNKWRYFNSLFLYLIKKEYFKMAAIIQVLRFKVT